MFSGASLLDAVKRRFGVPPRGAAAPLAVEAQAPSKAPLRVRASRGQPQSDREIQPVIEQLRGNLDQLLNIVWNAQAILIAKGSYTETGKLVPPVYEGRWQVIRALPRNEQTPDRQHTVICTLTEPQRQDGLLFMEKNGPYAPVGDWVLELMRAADAQNVRAFTERREKLWRQHNLLEEEEGKINEDEAREGLDRVHFKANYAGGVGNWSKGADFGEVSKSPLIIP